ncbi:MAG: hypothetical protein WAV30_00610 [Microgenomates group bacterium]
MITDKEIDFDDALIQLLFLLLKSPDFNTDIKALYKKHEQEIKDLQKLKRLVALMSNKAGSEALKNDFIELLKRCPLYDSPHRSNLRIVATFFLAGNYDINSILKEHESHHMIFHHDVAFNLRGSENGIKIDLDLSNYHSKTDVIKSINENWKEVEEMRNKFLNKHDIKLEKLRPIEDFKTAWSVYVNHVIENRPYETLYSTYKYPPSSMAMMVKRVKQKIESLYHR